MKQGVTPHACTPFDVTRHLGPGLVLMLTLTLMLSLAACGRQSAAPVSGSAALRDPNGFILDYDPDSGNAVTPSPEQEADAPPAAGDPAGHDTDSGSSSESKEEALNRILEKVEHRDPLTASETEQYQEHQRQVEHIREKLANGEALTATETRIIGEENRRIRERAETTPTTTSAKTVTTPAPKAADWSIRVDDNLTLELNGLTWHMNLYVSLNKAGGTDPSGTYQGKMLLTGKVDVADAIAQLEAESDATVDTFQQGHTTEAVSATLDMVVFDAQAYDAFMATDTEDGHADGSAPKALPAADWMATGTPEMVTRYQSAATGHDPNGNEVQGWTPDVEKKANVPVRLLVRGADVEVRWGRGNSPYLFKGTLVGTVK